MNIFKVLASGRKSFSEESASALLAWLLCPAMEHGLGANLLLELLNALQDHEPYGQPLFPDGSAESVLAPVLRTSETERPSLEIHLEKNVQTGFIDLVLHIKDLWISIENKIRVVSIHANKSQLREQYEGLRKELADPKQRIVSVFLTPRGTHPDELSEFDNLSFVDPKYSDFKVLVSWEDTGDKDVPSIAAMLRTILEKESLGEISPVPDYTRHTIKALLEAIRNEFVGYPYSSPAGSSGLNPKSAGRNSLAEIEATESIRFVGVADGVAGFLRLSINDLTTRTYQYSYEDMSGLRNWLTREEFIALVNWRLKPGKPIVQWDHTLPAHQLVEIAHAERDAVFVGVRGGASKLAEMSREDAEKKKWQIRRATTAPTSQWIRGDQFLDLLSRKGITPKSLDSAKSK